MVRLCQTVRIESNRERILCTLEKKTGGITHPQYSSSSQFLYDREEDDCQFQQRNKTKEPACREDYSVLVVDELTVQYCTAVLYCTVRVSDGPYFFHQSCVILMSLVIYNMLVLARSDGTVVVYWVSGVLSTTAIGTCSRERTAIYETTLLLSSLIENVYIYICI